MARNLKKLAMIGSLILAEAVFSVYNSGGYSTNPENNLEKIKTTYENYEVSKLEEKLKEEREKFSKPFYLTPDSLNSCIKQAYEEMKQEGKKWPEEFDKRLFRLMLKQESGYNIHAVSKTGYMGLGQAGYSLVETLRPEKWNTEFKNPVTGEIDSLAIRRYLFDPVENIKLSLEALGFFSRYCAKFDPEWGNSDLDTKRRKILTCYNAGNGTMKKFEFNYNHKGLTTEARKHHEKIMGNI